MRQNFVSRSVAAFLELVGFGDVVDRLATNVPSWRPRGRVYGHGSRKYAGPRDVAHRARRPDPAKLAAAWRKTTGMHRRPTISAA